MQDVYGKCIIGSTDLGNYGKKKCRVSLAKGLNSAFEFSARLVIIGSGRSIFLWFAGVRKKKRSLLPVPSLLASSPLPTPPCPQLVAKLPNCQ